MLATIFRKLDSLSNSKGQRRCVGLLSHLSSTTIANLMNNEQTNPQPNQQDGLGSLAIRVAMLPRDTNPGGTIFGGVILSHLDLAGGIEARKHADKLFVTVAIHGVEF